MQDPMPVLTQRNVTNEILHESEPLRYERMFRLAMDGAPQGMAVVGLDLMFKEVNETHGHAGGDEVLCVVAERIASDRRSSDLAARVGGDE